MSYFSRLTDIVTCNLTELLADEAQPERALQQIVREMEEGLSGAERSVRTASASVERLQKELDAHREQVERWKATAKRELADDNDDGARRALSLKQEVEDVIAGLEQQHQAAIATRDHLSTTMRALHARLAEARRKLQQYGSGGVDKDQATEDSQWTAADSATAVRTRQVEQELEALKRELGRN